MNDQLSDVTFELTLAFGAPTPDASAALKRRVLAWLAARGVTDFVEGVIDGVDTLVEGDDPLAAFTDEGRDTTPVSVFDFDEARLDALADAARAAFSGVGLGLKVSRLSTRSWSEAWQAEFAGLTTDGFVVRPVGAKLPEAAGRVLIELIPGAAFGAGDHATTEACLEALDELAARGRLRAGGRCLDVGTGTGILGIAAAKRGYGYVLGTDIDPDVLREAAKNCAANKVAMGLVCCDTPPPPGAPYDLVCANILVPVLHALMPHFKANLAAAGTVLLAGFIDKELPPLLATAAANGLKPFATRAVRGWVALALESS